MSTQRTIIILTLIATIAFTMPHFWYLFFDDNKQVEQSIKYNPFENISIEAKSAYVFDLNSGEVLYAKNESMQFPLASITKVMTALVATELIPNSGLRITIEKDMLKPEGDSGFLVGEFWRFKDMLDFTLVSSSNDGARAVASVAKFNSKYITYQKDNTAEEYFIQKMNEKAKKLGMTQTFFMNESGLDENVAVAGAYGSAKDLIILMTYIMEKYPHLLEATTRSGIQVESSSIKHDAKNTNQNVETFSGITASKTGFTNLAGGNLLISFEAGPIRPIIIAVLASSKDGRFEDVKKLLKASLESMDL